MKKRIKKATTWLLIVCMFMGAMPVFGSAAAADVNSVRSSEYVSVQADLRANELSAAAPDAQQPAEESGEGSAESSPEGLLGLLSILVQMFEAGLRSVSVNDLLKLPADVMDDVVTYIFAAFRILGVDMDFLYEKLTGIFASH